MKIKIEGLDMAHSESSDKAAAEDTAKRFGVIIELTGETGMSGWPTINVIGTPLQIQTMMLSEGGWSSGDDEQDAEMLFYTLQEAKVLIG